MSGKKLKKVLLVDDEDDFLEFLKKILSCRYQVLTASTGAQGLQVAKKSLPDVIILDINLPDMRGEEVRKRLQKDPLTSHIPIIYLTGILTKEDEQILNRLAGGVHALSKPVKSEELLQVIEEVLVILS